MNLTAVIILLSITKKDVIILYWKIIITTIFFILNLFLKKLNILDLILLLDLGTRTPTNPSEPTLAKALTTIYIYIVINLY